MTHIKQILFDADDTLWKNNIYYLKAANDFFVLLESAGYDKYEIDCAFNNLEKDVVAEYGYGSINFVYILETLFKKYPVSKDSARERLNSIIEEFNLHKKNKPLLFEHVPETMAKLKQRFDLFILTKGDFEEQKQKITNSGLTDYIKEYYILPEKDDQAYRDLISRNKWEANETCMVGNSPKSDINPALRNNMYAVYIPYNDTWKLDIEPIVNSNGKFKQLASFPELKKLFLDK